MMFASPKATATPSTWPRRGPRRTLRWIVALSVVAPAIACTGRGDAPSPQDQDQDQAQAQAPGAEAPAPAPEPDPAPAPETAPAVPAPPPGAEARERLAELDIAWVPIAGGSFDMPGDDDAETPHPTSVHAFEIAQAEVTNAQYARCVEAGACTEPDWVACESDEAARTKITRPELPVACVNWAQATAFAQWVGGRLPTEAEWTFAATSRGTRGPFPWGNAKPSCAKAVMNWGCREDAPAVPCSRPAGNTEQGVCDMAGNVSELMADVVEWDEDSRGRDVRINRGGSWHGVDPTYYRNSPKGPSLLRVAHRSRYAASMAENSMGFRPVRDWQIDPETPPAAEAVEAVPAE